jgi:hypothetical protein
MVVNHHANAVKMEKKTVVVVVEEKRVRPVVVANVVPVSMKNFSNDTNEHSRRDHDENKLTVETGAVRSNTEQVSIATKFSNWETNNIYFTSNILEAFPVIVETISRSSKIFARTDTSTVNITTEANYN